MTQHIHEGAACYQHGNNSPAPSATQAPANPQKLVTEHIDLWTSAVRHKSTAGRGSNRKIELAGINKLRELILELAVRGKLVPQNPEDEPASELLKRIEAEKAQLIKDGKLKKQKPLPAVTDEEKLFELPANWSWSRFGQICQHNSGKTLDASRNSGTLRPYITTSNLYWGLFQLSEVKEMPISDTELDKCQAVEGDLLICEGGEAGRAAVWESEKPVCFQNHIHRARPFGKISPYYLFRLFQRLDLSGEIANYRKGVAISNMSGKALSSIPVPLPPLAEQQRIVAKVDELMALCDQLEQQSEHQLDAHQQLTETLLSALLTPAAGALTDATSAQELSDNWQRLAQHFDLLFSGPMGAWAIDRLKDTILQLAVMGKLVPQNPDDEPAAELLKRIDAEKARLVKEGKIKKQKTLPSVSDDEKPFELPRAWEWVRIGRVANACDYGTSVKSSSTDNGIPVVSMGQVQHGSILLENLKYVPTDTPEIDTLLLEDGDLLYNRTNSAELVGKTGLFRGDSDKYTYASYLIRIRLSHASTNSTYINHVMNSPRFREIEIFPHVKQQCGQANVNGTIMQNMRIPLPPLAEQHRIVAKVDELFALCDQLKERLQHARNTQLNLTDTIVEQALN